MARRSEQRRAAAFALYQADLTGRSLTDTLPRDASLFTRALAHAADDLHEELDETIARHSEGWAIDRIAPLEKAIMRTALVEMLHPHAVRQDAPPGRRPGRPADPRGGGHRRGRRDGQEVRGRPVPGVRQRHP